MRTVTVYLDHQTWAIKFHEVKSMSRDGNWLQVRNPNGEHVINLDKFAYYTVEFV